MKNLRKFSVLAFAALFFMAACKRDDDNSATPSNNPGSEPQAQSFDVRMTDAPGDFEALNVTITSVDAYVEGKGWVNLENNAQAVNVLSLRNGKETSIASKSQAETGIYSKLRVTFDQDAKLQLNSNALVNFGGIILAGNQVQLNWRNNTSNQVEININEEVSANSGAEVLLDFDVASSVQQSSDKFILEPTIRVMQNANTGVKGEVSGTNNAAVMLSDGQKMYSTFIDAQGRFMIRGIESGTYKLTIDAAAKSETDIETEDKVIENVIVANGEMKQMGTVTVE